MTCSKPRLNSNPEKYYSLKPRIRQIFKKSKNDSLSNNYTGRAKNANIFLSKSGFIDSKKYRIRTIFLK
jgi:hypothetical protein